MKDYQLAEQVWRSHRGQSGAIAYRGKIISAVYQNNCWYTQMEAASGAAIDLFHPHPSAIAAISWGLEVLA